MSSRTSKDSDPAGEIRLRQTAQLTVADQTRTFEIAVTLPASASDEEIDRAARQAEIGMRALSEQLDRHIAAARETANGQMIDAHAPAPLLAEPHANGATSPAAPPAPVADVAEPPAAAEAPPPETKRAASKRAQNEKPAPEPAPIDNNGMDLTEFLEQATKLGYHDSLSVREALGVASFTDVDFAQALAQLRALHATPAPAAPTPPAEAASAPAPSPAFAEEIGPYDPVSDSDALAEMDDSDFGGFAEEPDDGVFAGEPEPAPAAPAATRAPTPEERRQSEAEKRLRQLRAIGGGTVAATPELRTALGNCFINPLGRELATDVVSAIWHLAPGEKLNAARSRALMEWGKEDDNLADTAARLVVLAHQVQEA